MGPVVLTFLIAVLAAIDALTISEMEEAASGIIQPTTETRLDLMMSDVCYNASDDVPTDSDEEFLTGSP